MAEDELIKLTSALIDATYFYDDEPYAFTIGKAQKNENQEIKLMMFCLLAGIFIEKESTYTDVIGG